MSWPDLPLKPAVLTAALAAVWVLEGVAPMVLHGGRRWRHDAGNIALGLGSAVLVGALFAAATAAVAAWSHRTGVGLLHQLRWPAAVETVLAFVALDCWQYWWHRANHAVPLLWRFHAVHHSDAAMTASTALRFHTGELLASAAVRLAVLPLLGITLAQVLVYEVVMLPVIIFHHANLRVPAPVDRALRAVVVTPWMHWVHHSEERPETDSNFGSVFSVWDRVFGSFRLRDDPTTIRLGLGLPERTWRTARGVLLMPFHRPPAPGDPPQPGRG